MEPEGEFKIIIGTRNIVLNETKEYESRKKKEEIENSSANPVLFNMKTYF